MFSILAVTSWSAGRAEVLDAYGASYLEDVDGLRVLHLKGTPTEMGQAHGHLLAEEARNVYQRLGWSFIGEMTQSQQTATATAARPYIPERFVEEVEAIAAGVNDELGVTAVWPARLLELHSWDEICRGAIDRGACAHFAALSTGTANGEVLVGVDYVDESAVWRGVADGAVVIVYEPTGRNSFCAVTWAGFAGVMLGMNNQGLVVSEARIAARGQRADGVPLPFQVRRVMEEASDVDSAEDLLRAIRRTVTGNVLVADGVAESAVRVFEFSPAQFEVFWEGHPGEEHNYTVEAKSVELGLSLGGYDVDLKLPDVKRDITFAVSRPLPNAIVRASYFVHHTGGSPLLEQQGLWFLEFLNTNPDFDFLDVSALPVQYPYPALDMMYMVDKMTAARARELLNPIVVAIIDAAMPGWEEDLYFPDTAALDRYARMSALVESHLGSIDPTAAIEILGGGVTPGPHDTLRAPASLHAVVANASTMELWIAQAPATGTPGVRDATGQPYRRFDFGAHATYPLTVQSTLVPAEVFVDDESWGETPLSRHVKPGQYVIVFGDVEGYATPATQIVTVGLEGATVIGEYKRQHELTVNVIGNGSVELDPPGGEYAEGTEVTVTALPDEGWYLLGWSGVTTGPDPSITLTLDEDATVTATFAEVPLTMYALTVDVTGEGQVEPSGGTFVANTEVALTATPAANWRFVEWLGDASGTNPEVQLTFDSDKFVEAVFERGTYTLTVGVEGEGVVTPSGGGYQPGQLVVLHAAPADGWHFAGWFGDANGAGASATVTMDADRSVTARFEANPTGKLAVTVQVEGQGTVEPGSGLYDEGATVDQAAAPPAGWEFIRWELDVESTDESISFTLQSDMVIRAVFAEKVDATLEVRKQGIGRVVVDPPGSTYPLGTQVTLHAQAGLEEIEAAPIWEFLRWEGDIESEENPLTVTLDDDVIVLAVFAQRAVVDDDSSCCCALPGAPVIGMLLAAGLLLTSRAKRGP